MEDGDLQGKRFREAPTGPSLLLSPAQTILQRQIYMPTLDYHLIFSHLICKTPDLPRHNSTAKVFGHRYLPSYPLVCLAAQYSQRAYMKPTGKEREAHVDANWRMGTKAMVIKSIPIDEQNTVVFAIRGSQTFMDWAVNLNSSPVSPSGFLVSLTMTVFLFWNCRTYCLIG